MRDDSPWGADGFRLKKKTSVFDQPFAKKLKHAKVQHYTLYFLANGSTNPDVF